MSSVEIQNLQVLDTDKFDIKHYCCHCQTIGRFKTEYHNTRFTIQHNCPAVQKNKRLHIFGECPFGICQEACQIALDIVKAQTSVVRASNFKWNHNEKFPEQKLNEFRHIIFKTQWIKQALEDGSLTLNMNDPYVKPADDARVPLLNQINNLVMTKSAEARKAKLLEYPKKPSSMVSSSSESTTLSLNPLNSEIALDQVSMSHTNSMSVSPTTDPSEYNVDEDITIQTTRTQRLQSKALQEDEDHDNSNNDNNNENNNWNTNDDNDNDNDNDNKQKGKLTKKKQTKSKKQNPYQMYWGHSRKQQFQQKRSLFTQAQQSGQNQSSKPDGIFREPILPLPKASPFRVQEPKPNSALVSSCTELYLQDTQNICYSFNMQHNWLLRHAYRNYLETHAMWLILRQIGHLKPNQRDRTSLMDCCNLIQCRRYNEVTQSIEKIQTGIDINRNDLHLFLDLFKLYCLYLQHGWEKCASELTSIQSNYHNSLDSTKHRPLFSVLFRLSQDIDSDMGSNHH